MTRWLEACPRGALGEGAMRLVREGALGIGVYNLGGELYALEDRCSHDDGPLCEGEFDGEAGVAVCPRHGARFDIRTGQPLTLPAFRPVETYPVRIEDGRVFVEIDGAATAA